MNSINMLTSLIIDLKKNEKRLNDDKINNYFVCQEVCKKLVESSNYSLNVYGKENIITDDNILITSNHNSFYDIFTLVSIIDKPMPFAAAKELMKYPVLNKYIKAIGCILIDRQTEDLKLMKKQLQDMEEALKNGSLILFPEGECSYNEYDEIKDFKKGGFMAASKYDIKIVPTYIKSDNMKNIGKWYVPNEDIEVIFGEGYTPTEIFGKKPSAKRLSEYTKDQILKLKRSI